MVEITLTKEEIKSRLLKSLAACPNAKDVADAIIGVASGTEYGMEAITRSLIQVPRILNYKIGQRVLLKYDYICTWRSDKDEMIKHNLIIKGDYVIGQISNIKEYSRFPYEISYKYYHKNENKIGTDTSMTDDKQLMPYDDWPVEL